MKKKICITLGTRPEIIRLATIINELRRDQTIDFKLVYTGQHYDLLMNYIFFKELGILPPDIDLKIGSGTHAEQTAGIMTNVEKYFKSYEPDMVAVFGDTNSSLAVSITAVKMKIPLAHLEAGCREWEMDIPEEVNRRLIDHCSNVLIAVSKNCAENLKKEKVLGDIYNCGDPLFDIFKTVYQKNKHSKNLNDLGVIKNEYVFLTVHRDKNVDDLKKLKQIMDALVLIQLPVIFPVHPRTKKQLGLLNYPKSKIRNIVFLDPFGYQDTIYFLRNAKLAITDSGGLQKEAFWCKTPCITIRDHTCWSETVDLGGNFLAKVDKDLIIKQISFILKNEKRIVKKIQKAKNPYSKPEITKNTVKIIKKYASKSWVVNRK